MLLLALEKVKSPHLEVSKAFMHGCTRKCFENPLTHSPLRVVLGLLLLLCTLGTPALAQTRWQMVIGDAQDEGASGVVLTADGRYAIAGYATTGVNRQPTLIKMDLNGAVLFQRQYTFAGSAEFTSIRLTPDGGFILAGNVSDAGNDDIFVMKTDAAGVVTWTTRLDNSASDGTIRDAVFATADGGYVVCGYTSLAAGCAGTACRATYVAKLTGAGAVAWQQRMDLEGGSEDFAVTGATLASGDYLIVGRLFVSGQAFKGFSMRLSAFTGAIIGPGQVSYWTLGNVNSPTTFTGLRPSGNPDEFLLSYVCPGAVNFDNGYLRLSTAGNAVNIVPGSLRLIGQPGAEAFPMAIPTADGGVAMGGFLQATVPASRRYMLAKFNAGDALEYVRDYGGAAPAADDSATAILQTADGGFLIVGVSKSFGNARQILVVKTDDAGTTSCNDNLLLLNSTNPANSVVQNIRTATATATSASPVVVSALAPQTVINPCCVGVNFAFTSVPVCFGQPSVLAPQVLPDFTDVVFTWDVNIDGILEDTTMGFPGSASIEMFPGSNQVRGYALDTLTGCIDSFTASVVVNALPITNAGPDFALCIGDTQQIAGQAGGSITWTILSGTPASLSATNIQDPLAFPTATSTYQMVVQNAQACRDTDTVVVTVNLLPVVTAGNDTLICLNGSATLSANGAGFYEWDNGIGIANNVVVSPLVSTTYLVEGFDANNCSDTASILVGVVGVQLAGGGDTINFCTNVPSVTIDATIVGATGCTYTWAPNLFILTNTGPVITVNPPADQQYTVIADCPLPTGGSCSDTDTVVVQVIAPPTASVSNDTTICVGDTITVSANGGIEWAWVSSDPASILTDTSLVSVDVSPIEPTTYTVTVTDPVSGCFTTGTVQVDTFQLPILNLGPDTLICEGGNVIRSIPAGFVSYLWTPDTQILGGFPNATIPNPTLVPSVSTTFSATVTDNRGCRGQDSLLVTVVQSPLALIDGVQVDTISMCMGDTLVLQASGGNAHLWMAPFNLFGDSLFVSPTDTIDIKMIASVSGCYSTANDTARLRINVVTPPSASFVSPFNGCQGQPVLVYFDGYYTPNLPNSIDNFIWDFDGGVVMDTVGIDSFLVQWAAIDTFLITLENQFPFCSRSQQSPIEIFSLPVVSAGPDISYCFGLTDTLHGTLTNISPGNCFVEWQPYFGLTNPFDITPITNIDTTSTYAVTSICNGCQGNTDSVTVFVLEKPTAVIDTFLLSFCAGGNVQLPGGGFGGTGNLRYNWYPVGNWFAVNSDTLATPTVTFNSDTTIQFKLVVTDRITGCVSDTAYIQVISYPNPVVNAGPDKVVCGGTGQGAFLEGTVVVGGFGNYQYQWSPSSFLSNPNTLQPYAAPPTTTVYTLTATNLNTGCSSSPLDTGATVTITTTARPIAEAGPLDTVYICLGDSVQIGGVPSQVGASVQYIWSPSQGLSFNDVQYPMASPPHTFKYYVQVVSNGCVSDADSVVIAINPLPVFRVDRPYYAICQDDSVAIGGNPLAGPNFDYTWTPTTGLDNPNSARPMASPDVTTTYTVTVSSSSCQGQIQDTVRVEVFEAPVATIPQNEFILCPDSPDSVQLLVTNTTSVLQPIILFWTPNDGTISDTTAQSPMVKPAQSQYYYLNLVAGACSSRYEFRVFVQPEINAEIEVDPGKQICAGTSVSLVARGGQGQATFLWLDDNSTDAIRTVTPDTTTTYTVVVTEGVCSDTATVTIEVTIQPIAAFSYTLAAGCDQPDQGLTMAFFDQSTNASWWAWDFGDGTPVVNDRNPVHTFFLPAGVDFQTFTVRLWVNGIGGCDTISADSNAVFLQRPGQASFTSNPTQAENLYVPNANVVFLNTSQRGVSYFWDFGDGQTSADEHPTHQWERPGLYTVSLQVTDAVGCTHSVDAGPYRVDAQDLIIPNVLTINGDEINEEWAPLYPGIQSYEAFVYDRTGNLLHSFRKGERGWLGTNANGQDMPAGVYFYSIKIHAANTTDEVERTLTGSITVIR